MTLDDVTIRYTYDLPEGEHTAIEVAQEVRSLWPSHSPVAAMTIARALMNGEGWEPPYSEVHYPKSAKILSYDITWPPNPYRAQAEEWRVQHELLKKGAAGDAEAAIAYCLLELNNEINHGPMA